MTNHLQELQNITPELIIGLGIFIAVIFEMYSKKSEMILPWFSMLVFLAAGIFSLLTINIRAIVFNGCRPARYHLHASWAEFPAIP